ncbi:GDP-mannose 4,6-dehydratase [Candidatus Pacearchaeota archaeon]|nr:GDP-mannose 4,6-dehydratase [Candidatus Pacearchaeota archaeon]
MYKTALITGVTGQDGSYLSEFLLDRGYKVYGLIRRSSVSTTERISHLKNHTNFELVDGDVTDCACMHRLISGIKPDEVYNLAAMSHVGVSFDQPITTCHIDAVGPLNILEAIRQGSPKTKFYQASTSELFGDTTIAPQSESTPMKPNSPYAVAKLYAHHLVGLYRRAYGIFACAGILFNHESERRGEDFVTRKITKYVASLQRWMDTNDGFPRKDIDVPPLALGNIEARRDWSHAEDMVSGMWLMLQHEKADDYVLGSGETHTVRDFLSLAFGSIGLDYKDYVIIDPKFYRPVDVNLLHADYRKAHTVLGWEPTVSFRELVDRMVQGDYKDILEGNKHYA